MPHATAGTKVVQVRLDEDDWEAVAITAIKQRVSIQEWVRRLILKELNKGGST